MVQLSMMMITVPIIFPLAQTFGFDLIWFAVIVLLALEISFTTPPFGLLLFVMRGVVPSSITMGQIYRAAVPFLIIKLIVLALIVLVPALGTWLPKQLVG
jgi:TRAP-type mannitol/chloroaromatic compound transport system permease large subunit